METDCLLVNTSLGASNVFNKISHFSEWRPPVCSHYLSLRCPLCRAGGAFLPHCVSTTSAPQSRRRSNQCRIKQLIIHSWVCQLHQRISLQSPSPLAQNYWVQGKDMPESLWISERERTHDCVVCTPLQTFWCVCVYFGGCVCVFFSWGCALIFVHYYVALGGNSITLSVCEATCQQVFHAKSIMDWRRTFNICTGGSVGPLPSTGGSGLCCALLWGCARMAVNASKAAFCGQMCIY